MIVLNTYDFLLLKICHINLIHFTHQVLHTDIRQVILNNCVISIAIAVWDTVEAFNFTFSIAI